MTCLRQTDKGMVACLMRTDRGMVACLRQAVRVGHAMFNLRQVAEQTVACSMQTARENDGMFDTDWQKV